jgi:hypothetical protein
LLKLYQMTREPVQINDDKAKTNEIKTTWYVQCSAMQQYGLKPILDLELMTTMKPKEKSRYLLL